MRPMETSAGITKRLLTIYDRLDGHFGNLRWWPADSPFEVIVGAILTQNTAWRNVTYAIAKLKEADILHPQGIYEIPLDTLAALIRSSGYYHVKARRLAAFVRFIHDEYKGRLDSMFAQDHRLLRTKLLQIQGIGNETADSILLYAGEKPVFVIDAYTRRILELHGILAGKESYADIQALFMDHLPVSVPLYNQYHALLVNTGKMYCRKDGHCEACPLKAQGADRSVSRGTLLSAS
jgi:endonuclease-3 related protein